MSSPAGFITLTGSGAYDEALQSLVGAARLQLSLISVDLDRRVFGTDMFVESVKQFLLAQRRARVRLLIHHPRSVMGSGHRLVELGRALSSRMEVRQMPDERMRSREEFLIVDERHVLTRSSPQELDARCYRDAPLEARAQLRIFEQIWNEALPARELSELKL